MNQIDHLTETELMEYLDKEMHDSMLLQVKNHLEVCSHCSNRLQSNVVLNRIICEVPYEKVSIDFTTRVMSKISAEEVPSFIWTIMKNLAPLAMATIILFIVGGVFYVTGAWDNPELSGATGISKSAYQTFTTQLTTVNKDVNNFLVKIFPFRFTGDGFMLTFFLICFFSAIALMDKYIFSGMMKKKWGSHSPMV